MDNHIFILKGQWNGGLTGIGQIDVGNLQYTISAPVDLGGIGEGTNPEEMFLGAAATCYLITLGNILTRRKKNVEQLSITSEAKVSKSSGRLKIESIKHSPEIILQSDSIEADIEEVIAFAQKADQLCMISNAIKGNVEVHVEPVCKISKVSPFDLI